MSKKWLKIAIDASSPKKVVVMLYFSPFLLSFPPALSVRKPHRQPKLRPVKYNPGADIRINLRGCTYILYTLEYRGSIRGLEWLTLRIKTCFPSSDNAYLSKYIYYTYTPERIGYIWYRLHSNFYINICIIVSIIDQHFFINSLYRYIVRYENIRLIESYCLLVNMDTKTYPLPVFHIRLYYITTFKFKFITIMHAVYIYLRFTVSFTSRIATYLNTYTRHPIDPASVKFRRINRSINTDQPFCFICV